MFNFVNVFLCGKINVANYQNNHRLCSNWQLTSFYCRLSSLIKSTKRQCQQNTFLILLIPSKCGFFFIRSLDFFLVNFISVVPGRPTSYRALRNRRDGLMCMFYFSSFYFLFFIFLLLRFF